MSTTKQQIEAAFRVTAALGDAIRELGSVPSCHLYAMLCGKISLEIYDHVIAALVDTKLVRQDASFLLTWIGPKA